MNAYSQQHLPDPRFDNSREIVVSDDMKRSLNHVMEEDEGEGSTEEFQYIKHQKPPRTGHRGSFGQPDPNESERFDIGSTPKMGHKATKHTDENMEPQVKNENMNPYHDQSSKTEDFENEIGLNLSKIDLKNKNFSDLVTNGKINKDILKDRILKNQALYDEYSDSFPHQVLEESTNNQILGKSSSNEGNYEEGSRFESNSKGIEPKVMHSRELANQFIFNNRENSRRNDKVNSSCIVVSRSHADLGLKSSEKSSIRDISNFQTAFEILIENLSALETDIARNFKVVDNKFALFQRTHETLEFDAEGFRGQLESYGKRIDSIENCISLSSERKDKIMKMCDKLSQQLTESDKEKGSLEARIHDLELARMSDENRRKELLQTSIPISQEMESMIQNLQERVENFESNLAKNEDRTKKLEIQTQRSSKSESNFDRR